MTRTSSKTIAKHQKRIFENKTNNINNNANKYQRDKVVDIKQTIMHKKIVNFQKQTYELSSAY